MKTVTVLLSTYNGEKYLKAQLDSLIAQKNVSLNILVRDDGSSDSTIDILKKYKEKGFLNWYTGNNKKTAMSFYDLMLHAPKSDYYAFCDQDDVWLEDKLYIAIEKLNKFDDKYPCLYYGTPRLVDSNLCNIKNPKSSYHCMKKFSQSIINSNATGCTMVFNNCLLKIVTEKKPLYIDMHDSWIHKVCIISGGNLVFDEDVHILYRQHSNNVIGINKSFTNVVRKKFNSLTKKEKSRSRVICSLYDLYNSTMSIEDKKLALLVKNYSNSLYDRLKLLFCFKIKTKYIIRNICFRFAVLLNIF